MKQNATDITIVLDRSGSMASVRTDTVGGFNVFLNEQKKAPGEASLTLAQFDHEYEVVHDGKKISDVPELTTETFVPRGNTALLDAIGRSIIATGKRLSDVPENDRPANVVFVIITDGHENASREYNSAKVFEMINHQRDAYKWQFVFMGANQDAIKTATSLGMAAGSSMTYASNAAGTRSAFADAASNVKSYRASGQSVHLNFNEEQRKTQKSAGATT